MNPIDAIFDKLPNGASKSGDGWMACCPAHKDRKASLSVGVGDDGRVLLKCFAGCSFKDIVAAMGMKPADLMPPGGKAVTARSKRPPRSTKPAPDRGKKNRDPKTYPTAREAFKSLKVPASAKKVYWEYQDADEEIIAYVVRWETTNGKEIRPITKIGDGWAAAAMPDPRPLYRLPEVLKADRVLVTEGEKAADAARSIGFATTTSAGGSQAANRTDWAPLAGKEVWIFPDNDEPGRKYAAEVFRILSRLEPAPTVRVVELPDLPPKGDMADWLASKSEAATLDDLRAELMGLAEAAPPYEPDAPGDIADDLQYKPFPVDLLPSPIRELVDEGSKAILCDPSFIALPLLVALGSAIGMSRRLQLKRGWHAPPILWGAVVCYSGSAKTPAFKLAMQPVEDRQRKSLDRYNEAMKRHQSDMATYEKEYAEWKRRKGNAGDPPEKPLEPLAERCLVKDATVESLAPILLANPRGVLVARDELAAWLGSFDRYAAKGKSGSDSANWLSLFNGESITVDRKTGTPRTIYVSDAAACIVGGIQPGTLQRVLGTEYRESGLAARLLQAFPPRIPKKWTEADIDPLCVVKVEDVFHRLYAVEPILDDGRNRPITVKMNEEAKSAWVNYYNSHNEEQSDLDEDLSAAWSKLEEAAARLALIIHCVHVAAGDKSIVDPNILDLASMNAGIGLTEWFKNEARRVYAMLDESEADRDQRKLIEWLQRRDGTVTAREVQQGCRWLKDSGAAESALVELVKAGCGEWETVSPDGKGGRPSRAFRLSASSASTKPLDSQGERGFVDVDAVGALKTTSAVTLSSGSRESLFPDLRGLPD